MIKNYRFVLLLGCIEILIGLVTLFFNFFSLIFGTNTKSPSVLFFVTIAAVASSAIGVGILKFYKIAYQSLLYFSSVIVLTKILILMGVIHLDGALETTVPSSVKTLISIFYHGFVIYFLLKPEIKRNFHD
jgi:NADH:ubiquinone oxidoreductase subunit K